jgi:hypothetical protein
MKRNKAYQRRYDLPIMRTQGFTAVYEELPRFHGDGRLSEDSMSFTAVYE